MKIFAACAALRRSQANSFARVLRACALCLLVAGLSRATAAAQADPAATPATQPEAAAESGAPAPEQPAPISPSTAPAESPSAAGPRIELPPDEQLGEPAANAAAASKSAWPSLQFGVTPPDDALLRGLQPTRMAQSSTVVGGYGQFTLNSVRTGQTHEFDTQASVRRLVLFVAHPITEDIRIYTEFEWENAVACASCAGSAEVEQAFVHARLLGDALAFRAGLVLVPMGIVNQWHEPPVFNGVERPNVDQFIIPTTWRELGVGFAGELAELVRYELYLTTTLNPLRLSETGLTSARTLGSFAPANAFAVTGRAEVEPILGMIAGASFFASDMGPNGKYYTQGGKRRSLHLPLLGYALDARIRRAGFEARIVWSQFFLPASDDLVASYREDGSPLFPREASIGTVPERIQGGYAELAYNVLDQLHISHELLAFVRLEMFDTQAAVPQGYKRNPALDIEELTLGLTYRPVTQLVFKSDLQLRDRRLGYDALQINLGFGYMF